MGAAASSSPPPPLEAATAASDPPATPQETASPPAKEGPQHSTAAAGDAAAVASANAGGGGAADADADAAETVVLDASAAASEAGKGEEEQGECGFCLFMKGGGCKEEFTAWEKCVEEAEAATSGVDVVERCQDITAALRKCMDAHAEYYEPILRAERAMAADLEAFQAEEAASNSAVLASEGGQKKQVADAAAPPSEEGQKKQVAEAAVLDKESRDPAA
ncbi:hypothetical protein BAE44_0002772 [Dichanthelium oligosanthes]|uniref:GCK domain-containing protein n=1 Tax=Dichanthelium oligosanthes TaxID=888268 RepID=A0A1E5WFW9_9POAL|nr:hypothetical protein BAE44_0002772 [Dichanthelium oligosanthes]